MQSFRRLLHLLPLLIFLGTTIPSSAQGKSAAKIDNLEQEALNLYQEGRYKEACDILINTTEARSGEHFSRITTGLMIFLLVDILGVFFFLYIEKRKALKLLVEKNAECAQRPVLNVAAIKIGEDSELEAEERRNLETLQTLFEQEKIYLNSDLTIESLAMRVGISKAAMSKLINQHLECSFPTLLNRYRINEAVRLISSPKTSDYKLEAISLMCGYNNRQVFHSAFKKETGLTPLEFKKVGASKD